MRSTKFTLFVLCALPMLLSVSSVSAQEIGPIRFDEPEFPPPDPMGGGVPLDGFVLLTLDGMIIPTVTFDGPIFLGEFGPGTTALIDPPHLQSDSPFALEFGAEIFQISYAFALFTTSVVQDAAILRAFDAGGMEIGSASADALLENGAVFAENRLTFNSEVPFVRVELEFNNNGNEYVVDNLNFATVPGPPPPEPLEIPTLDQLGLAILAALLALCALAVARRRARSPRVH